MKRLACILLGCLFSAGLSRAAPEPGGVFARNEVISIVLQIGPAGIQALQQNPRTYVRGKISRGTNVFSETEVRLKGNATFRSIDAKASFSVKLSPAAQREFGGHKRLLLNNAVQDESYLRAKLASEMFLKAGLPTARINFATVTLNGKQLGLYLLVEGTDDKFLTTHFGSAEGNLYEGADQDINAPLEIDASKHGTDRSDLKVLLNACTTEDLPTRWKRLSQILDKNRFAKFMAMELLVGHKDGYCMDLNNYRLYHDAESRKFVFIAHGMDFTLDNPVLMQDRDWKGVVVRAFIEVPEGMRLFQQQVNELGSRFYGDGQLLSARVEELWKVIEPVMVDQREKRRALTEVGNLQMILRARAASFPKFAATLEGNSSR